MSSLLSLNSTPAERFAGCTFATHLRNPQAIVEDGGTIVGTPTFDRDGIILNGTTDYSEFALSGNGFNSSEISLVLEFWPDFTPDADTTYIFDTKTGDRCALSKISPGSGSLLRLILGGTTVGDVPKSTYESLWKVNERNVVQISGTSGDTSIWWNGVLILDSSATAWAISDIPQILKVGVYYNADAFFFTGKFGEFKIFHGLLDANDAARYYNRDMYSYRDEAIIDLPMRAAQHDPTNSKTLDISGGRHSKNGNDFTLSSIVKLARRGYGGQLCRMYMLNCPLDLESGFTMFGHARCDTNYLSGFYSIRENSTNGVFAQYSSGNFEAYYNAVSASYSIGNKAVTFVVVYDVDGDISLYINGVLRDTADISGQTLASNATHLFVKTLSNDASSVNILDGEYYQFGSIQKLLSPIQAADLHLQMLARADWV